MSRSGLFCCQNVIFPRRDLNARLFAFRNQHWTALYLAITNKKLLRNSLDLSSATNKALLDPPRATMLLSAITATLFVATQADHHEATVTIFTDLADLNISVESIEYDADRDIYYFCNLNDGGVGTISGLDTDSPVFTEDVIPSAPATCTGVAFHHLNFLLMHFCVFLLHRNGVPKRHAICQQLGWCLQHV